MTVVAAGCFARGKAGSTETTPKENTYLPAGITGDARDDKAEARRTPRPRYTLSFIHVPTGTAFFGELNNDAAEEVSI